MKNFALVLILLLIPLKAVQAEEVMANFRGIEILDACEASISGSDVIKGKICSGYVIGMADGPNTLAKLGHKMIRWCKPINVTEEQLVKIVQEYLIERPEDLHHPAAKLVAQAFVEAFPCTAK